MGIYLNPENDGFWEAVRSKIYVDKTGLIACTNNFINTKQKFVCVSRPRRFGKSMTLEMLAAYYSARKDYKLIREFPTGRGFADIIFLPLPHTGKPALVVELKYDKSVQAAIQQIKDRHYTQALEGYTGEILLVGINYDRDNVDKPHSCIMEKFEKC